MVSTEQSLADGDVVWGFVPPKAPAWTTLIVTDTPQVVAVERMTYDAARRHLKTNSWTFHSFGDVEVYRDGEEAVRAARAASYREWAQNLTRAERQSSESLQRARAAVEEHTVLLERYARLRGRAVVEFEREVGRG